MDEEKRLAVVVSKNQCSQKPSYHRTYRDREGNRLKMRVVYLPSSLYRPDIDFGVDSHGIDRNNRMAFLNVPWNMIKHDRSDDSKRYFYLNRESYNIQFKGRIKSDGTIEKVDCLNVSAKELENIFNWSRRRENRHIITERLKKAEQARKQENMDIKTEIKTKSKTR